jgi:drug/metabolite transporter (DMT)-like permease
MLESWIFWTLLAATMQAVRTAGQKRLNLTVSAEGATLVRYLFGLPFMAGYFAIVGDFSTFPAATGEFWLKVLVASILQILATVLLVRLFALRNFAVGSTYIRLEIVLTALLGLALFGDALSLLAGLGMAVCTLGLLRINADTTVSLRQFFGQDARLGLLSALAFSLTSLLVRDASLSLGLSSALEAGATTLMAMIVLQTVLTLSLVGFKASKDFLQLGKQWRLATFVGVTGVLGSIGWFTAFTLEPAAVVKTLGQIEIVLALGISYLWFKERPTIREWQGIALIVLGVAGVLLSYF